VKKKNKSVLKDIQILIEQTGGIDYANKKLDEYSNRALDALSIYPESEYKMSLVNLVSFNKSRVK
jgi:octaprenyl-diphosphate synthase